MGFILCQTFLPPGPCDQFFALDPTQGEKSDRSQFCAAVGTIKNNHSPAVVLVLNYLESKTSRTSIQTGRLA